MRVLSHASLALTCALSPACFLKCALTCVLYVLSCVFQSAEMCLLTVVTSTQIFVWSRLNCKTKASSLVPFLSLAMP